MFHSEDNRKGSIARRRSREKGEKGRREAKEGERGGREREEEERSLKQIDSILL